MTSRRDGLSEEPAILTVSDGTGPECGARNPDPEPPGLMYSSCLFCHALLGANRSLEELPVGRRLAFDGVRGRLWVVCRRCGRWNLTPLDERWEAIEACERSFRATRLRAFTDNIGLARLDEGLELVRIGKPLPPEYAAWRYGSRLARRYRHRAWQEAGRVATYALAGAWPLVLLAGGPLALIAYAGAATAAGARLRRVPALRIPVGRSGDVGLSRGQVQQALLIRDDTVPDGWGLVVEHLPEPAYPGEPDHERFESPSLVLSGEDARRAAAILLPALNPLGGDPEAVADAVRWLEAAGGPERAFRAFTRGRFLRPPLDAVRTHIATLHRGVRLALEMALHEDEERRALAGELSILEWAWRYEERLAAIADRLTLPEWIHQRLFALHRTPGS